VVNLVKPTRRLFANLTLWFVALSLVLGARFAIALPTKNVLVLYSNNRLVPANIEVDHGLSDALMRDGDRSIRTYSEFLDRPEFGGDAYEDLVVAYLHGKYATTPPDVIVTVSNDALSFVVRHRAQLFPRAPIVSAVASTATLRGISPMPADIVGVPNDYDYSGTISEALRLQPTARRLVVVTGASPQDQKTATDLRRGVPAVAGNVRTEYWSGLPLAVLQSRLATLRSGTVVFTSGFWQDGDGKAFSPRDAAALIARASSAPVYGPYDTFIGTGVVGGRMPSFVEMGRQAGDTVRAILAGAAPGTLQLPKATPTTLHVDWRQVLRWGIDPKLLPRDTVIAFRSPTLWQAYRNAVLGAVTVIVLLSGLVVSLLLERRRRRTAEIAVQRQHIALAHASRLAVAGELTAAIAHEINQPLGAVQTNADTAEVLLQAGGDRREDLLRLVGRIQGDNLRASEVIKRLRALLAKHEARRQPLDLNLVLTDVEVFLRTELKRRDMTLALRPAAQPARILGDETQIQQVLINLILNSMDASAEAPADRRVILVQVESTAGTHVFSVMDRGSGFANTDLSKLFDSFFSTKRQGMGLGLSIARTIVEAHGGTIRADNDPSGGAIFHVRLPAHDASENT
jgi:signal transduction histidine kinase